VARAQGAVHALVVARDRRVGLGVVQLRAQLVHRRVEPGAAHALRGLVQGLALGGLARRHALERRRQGH
jgi:hypothetical protein